MTKPLESFDRPQPVTDVLLAFPASVMHLMPAMADIPEDFRSGLYGRGEAEPWGRAAAELFHQGRPERDLLTKDGVDDVIAWRHIKTIAGSYEPKHEHKMAALAYLLSRWYVFA